jgi:hypothetical protein
MGYMGADAGEAPSLLDWLPDAAALYANRLLLHELLGRAWYHLRYYRSPPA